MVEKTDTVSADGVKSDGVSFYPASPEQLQSFRDASEALSRFKAPVLAHASNPHERIFLAASVGTGNDSNNYPEPITTPGRIPDQVEALIETGEMQIHVQYLTGLGTQNTRLERAWHGARGHSY